MANGTEIEFANALLAIPAEERWDAVRAVLNDLAKIEGKPTEDFAEESRAQAQAEIREEAELALTLDLQRIAMGLPTGVHI